ncbi:E3 ubiquitin/ISG15 ligase TRIM25-like [Mixophyes fleayi]|uniref:E3 ubiquitin/ISG15 ligase TRIM25-like n=1 Tax=Mixophyes fleayi TaxID=3061075 RepID=UPI003F4D8FA5
MASTDLRAELRCSICMEIYKDPVTLRCGHNFCGVCITQTWDHQKKEDYTCPECMERFTTRPKIKRNLTLCKIAEAFQCTQPQQEVDGVFCTFCDFAVPAAKTCLQCETPMCDNHLRKHDRLVEHTLISPTMSITERKCSIHKKILEYYCTEDTACICVTCRLDEEHRGHLVELLDEAFEKKTEKLRHVLKKLTSKREEIDRRVQSLQNRRNEVQEKAVGEIERYDSLFREIERQLEALKKRVLSEPSRQEQQVLLLVSDLIQELDVQKDELSRKMHHIEELCNITVPVAFLQEADRGDLCDTENQDYADKERYDKRVHDVGDLNEGFIAKILHIGLSDIITTVSGSIDVQTPRGILLDANVAGYYVHISNDLKTATQSQVKQNCSETLERFQGSQVLSTGGFSSGRHCWEVETSKSGDWKVGMCYPSIDRKGDQSYIGYNNKSWCLGRIYNNNNNNQYVVLHDSKKIQLHHNISCYRVMIYLDYEAGQLSFYEICQPMRHLHTFTATFTEPLYAALWVMTNCTVTISG